VLFGKVMGTVVSSRKDEKLEGLKFQVLEVIDIYGKPTKNYVVAADSVQAGIGEIVLYATGSSARQTTITNNRPCDAVIMAIVDTWDVGGNIIYTKE